MRVDFAVYKASVSFCHLLSETLKKESGCSRDFNLSLMKDSDSSSLGMGIQKLRVSAAYIDGGGENVKKRKWVLELVEDGLLGVMPFLRQLSWYIGST